MNTNYFAYLTTNKRCIIPTKLLQSLWEKNVTNKLTDHFQQKGVNSVNVRMYNGGKEFVNLAQPAILVDAAAKDCNEFDKVVQDVVNHLNEKISFNLLKALGETHQVFEDKASYLYNFDDSSNAQRTSELWYEKIMPTNIVQKFNPEQTIYPPLVTHLQLDALYFHDNIKRLSELEQLGYNQNMKGVILSLANFKNPTDINTFFDNTHPLISTMLDDLIDRPFEYLWDLSHLEFSDYTHFSEFNFNPFWGVITHYENLFPRKKSKSGFVYNLPQAGLNVISPKFRNIITKTLHEHRDHPTKLCFKHNEIPKQNVQLRKIISLLGGEYKNIVDVGFTGISYLTDNTWYSNQPYATLEKVGTYQKVYQYTKERPICRLT